MRTLEGGALTPLGYVQFTPTTVSGLPAIPRGAVLAMIHTAGSTRWRDDGVDPTASVGMPAAVGTPSGDGLTFIYDGDLHAFRIIGDVEVNVSYYGQRVRK